MAKKHCEFCGASMVKYRRHLSVGLGNCLKALAEAGGDSVPICTLDLTNSEYSAIAKLSLWGLIEKATSEGDRKGRGGHWTVTTKGWLFVRGEIALPENLMVYRGEVLEELPGKVRIHDISDGWWFKPREVAESEPHQGYLI